MNFRPQFRMYVDEVGNSSKGLTSHINNRFFGLAGAVVDLAYEPQMAKQMAAVKVKYFGSSSIILHRNDIERRGGDFKALYDPQIEANFNNELLTLLNGWQYYVFAVCLDKFSLQQKQALTRDPYAQAMTVLLEQYVSFLINMESRGDVMMEARGKGEDIAIKKDFTRLWLTGSRGKRFQKVLTSKHPKIRLKSDNEAGLQLADMIAYPSQLYATQSQVPLQLVQGMSSLTQNLIQLLPTKSYPLDGSGQSIMFLT